MNSWTIKAAITTARWCLAADTACGKAYVIGGAGQSNERIKTVEVYDPAADTGEVTSILSPEKSSLFPVLAFIPITEIFILQSPF